MTWPPPPASDPWESQTIPPGEPPPHRDDAADEEPSTPDPQPFEGGWETPTGARVSQTGATEPPFPVPSFDPDWNVTGDGADTPVAPAADDWEPPAPPDAVTAFQPPAATGAPEPAPEPEPPTRDVQPESDVAQPISADTTWEAPSNPVLQPTAELAPPPVALGWDPPADPVHQPVTDAAYTGAGHTDAGLDEHRHPPRWEQDAPPDGSEPGIAPPPGYGTGDGQWSGLYQAPPPVVPRPTGRAVPLRVVLIGGGVLVTLVLVVVLVMWMVSPSPDTDTAGAATTSEPAPADTEAQDRLLRALPRGYAPQACDPAAATGTAVAQIDCAQNTDPGGPNTSTYALYPDRAALDAAFQALVDSSQVVVCPGRIQSPGPWRRNATPDRVSGTLLCALEDDRPTISWTDVDELLIGTVESRPGGPAFDQLYTWWAAHS